MIKSIIMFSVVFMKYMKNILTSLVFLFNTFLIYSQCACVWKNSSGQIQCQLYSNCSSPNLTNCTTKVTGGTMCPCTVYPGMNFICGTCQVNGACWYNGTSCLASQVCTLIYLPVELINFDGEKNGSVNNLMWSTASEYNSDIFIIEHSVDGKNFEELVSLPALGFSTEKHDYFVTHQDPEMVINYYRIKQIDFDGEYKIYGPIAIDNRENGGLVKIIDILGRPVDENYKGMVIHILEDGSTVKTYQ